MGETHLAWMIVGGEQSDCNQSCKQCCIVAWFRWAGQSENLSQRRATASSSDSSSLPADGMPWVWDYSWKGIKRMKCGLNRDLFLGHWDRKCPMKVIFFSSLRSCGSFTSHSCVFFELPVSVCSTKTDLVFFGIGWPSSGLGELTVLFVDWSRHKNLVNCSTLTSHTWIHHRKK